MLSAAYGWLNVPYVYGASSREGTDCSGFTLRIYEQIGILLPRSAREQSFMGTDVGRDELKPGDLIFFNTIGDSVSHVGLYVGKGTMIHASSRYGVITQTLDADYYSRTFVAAKRVL
jgi:murein DD-endopeptidase / murein LD-carboxypeptidase